MPYHAMPCHAVPCRAVPCHAMLCRAMPCHAGVTRGRDAAGQAARLGRRTDAPHGDDAWRRWRTAKGARERLDAEAGELVVLEHQHLQPGRAAMPPAAALSRAGSAWGIAHRRHRCMPADSGLLWLSALWLCVPRRRRLFDGCRTNGNAHTTWRRIYRGRVPCTVPVAARRGAAWCLQRRVALQRVRERVGPLHCIALHCIAAHARTQRRLSASTRLSSFRCDEATRPGRAGPGRCATLGAHSARSHAGTVGCSGARSLAGTSAGGPRVRAGLLVWLFVCAPCRRCRSTPTKGTCHAADCQDWCCPVLPATHLPRRPPAQPLARAPARRHPVRLPFCCKAPGVRP
jgi:hypothetical protein